MYRRSDGAAILPRPHRQLQSKSERGQRRARRRPRVNPVCSKFSLSPVSEQKLHSVSSSAGQVSHTASVCIQPQGECTGTGKERPDFSRGRGGGEEGRSVKSTRGKSVTFRRRRARRDNQRVLIRGVTTGAPNCSVTVSAQ